MLFLVAFGAFVLYYSTTAVLAWCKLRHFPGTFLASFSTLWLLRAALSTKAYTHRVAARKRCGPGLIRIGPDMLITDDPDVFRRIHGVRGGYTRGRWYAALGFDPRRPIMLSCADVAFHDDIKARSAAGYSGREVPGMERDIDEVIAGLVALIERKYLSEDGGTLRPMDWALTSQFLTLDALTKVAYGYAFGYLETDSDVHEFVTSMEEKSMYFAVLADVQWIGRIMLSPWFLRLFGPSATDKKGLGVAMRIAKQVVTARFESKPDAAKEQQDMLASFLRHGLSRDQCEAELPTQLSAGSDTTANVFRLGLAYLASTPRVYCRLQQEIDDSIASGQISSPITAAEGKRLPYLQAFIRECLRFNPPVSILVPKVVPPGGDVIDGKSVPAGAQIAVDFPSMGRRKDVYGEDAEMFRPERFLEASPERRAVMEKTTDLMFGHGRYLCPGKTMAWLEANKVFVELLRRFDFQMLNPEMPFTKEHHSLFVIRDMWMRVTKRQA